MEAGEVATQKVAKAQGLTDALRAPFWRRVHKKSGCQRRGDAIAGAIDGDVKSEVHHPVRQPWFSSVGNPWKTRG